MYAAGGHPLLDRRSGRAAIADPLFARGLVLEGAERPIGCWRLTGASCATMPMRVGGGDAVAANTTIDRVLISSLRNMTRRTRSHGAATAGGRERVAIGDLDFHDRRCSAWPPRCGGSGQARAYARRGGQRRVEQVASSRRVTLPTAR
jgi:hypothetical protein